MKKGLFLYGLNCTLSVWDGLRNELEPANATFAAYPHAVTQRAQSIADITRWVYEEYGRTPFDFICGHSMGGLIALELAAVYRMPCGSVLFIESNLRPANAFYRNLMLPASMARYGGAVKRMLAQEAPFYTDALKASITADFDFTPYIHQITCPVFGIYGDRGTPAYENRITDLCLDAATEAKIDFRFVRDACHMPMIENPRDLAAVLTACLA